MSNHNIKIESSATKGRAFVGESTHPDAEMTYSIAGEHLIIIDHTQVEEAHRGEGLGRILLDEIVNMAREKSIKIIPLCPFAKAQFAKDESIRDVLK